MFRSLWRWLLSLDQPFPRKAAASPQNPPCQPEAIPPYRVFSRSLDLVVPAQDLDLVLGPMSVANRAAHDEAWQAFTGALQGWRTKVHLVALDAAARIINAMGTDAGSSTTFTILVDQSGSMRGQNMILAASSTDVACDFIIHLGASVEVLGFTTRSWRGGGSRKRWLFNLRQPRKPGRLCDLLHVIYRDAADRRASTCGSQLRPMLRPDLPKENVDGEAIEWAATRLRTRPEPKKILIVISDGAPVDDSTLLANGPDILDQHLREVVDELQRSKDIDIAAVGIGFDVSQYYKTSRTVRTPEDLGNALIGLIEDTVMARAA